MRQLHPCRRRQLRHLAVGCGEQELEGVVALAHERRGVARQVEGAEPAVELRRLGAALLRLGGARARLAAAAAEELRRLELSVLEPQALELLGEQLETLVYASVKIADRVARESRWGVRI